MALRSRSLGTVLSLPVRTRPIEHSAPLRPLQPAGELRLQLDVMGYANLALVIHAAQMQVGNPHPSTEVYTEVAGPRS